MQELRKIITGQCGIKSDCTVGVLDTRHVLIRLMTMKDYVHLLSTPAFYVKAKENYWQMRTLRWDPWFELDIETTIGKIHPELYHSESEQKEKEEYAKSRIGTTADQKRILTIGNIVGNKQNRQKWMALREEEERDQDDSNEGRALAESTKEWVNKAFESKKKGEAENKKEACKGTNENDANRKVEVNKESKQIQSPNKEKIEKDNEEVLPLSIHNRYEGSVENHEGSVDKVDMHRKISKVVINGHLSLTQVDKMKDKVVKKKNQGEKDNAGAQASSRQSKRTIIYKKKCKYQ
ncbi:hypothetical protein H5410_014874 [Solanum commersonii]|uniref:DUF4283 domain-containing protein n=1 Tax=Solanum commersonii TaxID=4109 RepID=A0A9J5ZSP2_SOLCO|nr:hypothetical protein H5410_014874 [Solanum commersonii]